MDGDKPVRTSLCFSGKGFAGSVGVTVGRSILGGGTFSAFLAVSLYSLLVLVSVATCSFDTSASLKRLYVSEHLKT
jgi:hypothetical protein